MPTLTIHQGEVISAQHELGERPRTPFHSKTVQHTTTHYHLTRKVGGDIVLFKIRKYVPESQVVKHKDGTSTRFHFERFTSRTEAGHMADLMQYCMKCMRKLVKDQRFMQENDYQWVRMAVDKYGQIGVV